MFDDVRAVVSVGDDAAAAADQQVLSAATTTSGPYPFADSASLAAMGIGYARSSSRQSLVSGGGGSGQAPQNSFGASIESQPYVRSPSASLVSSSGSTLQQQQQPFQSDALRGTNPYPYPYPQFGGSSQSLQIGLENQSASSQNQMGSLRRRMASASPSPGPSVASDSSALGSIASGTSSKRSSLHLGAAGASPLSLLRLEPRRFTCLHLAARNGHVDILACDFFHISIICLLLVHIYSTL